MANRGLTMSNMCAPLVMLHVNMLFWQFANVCKRDVTVYLADAEPLIYECLPAGGSTMLSLIKLAFYKPGTVSAPPSGSCCRDNGSCVNDLRFTCSMYDVISALNKYSNAAAQPDRISFASLKKIAPQIANPFLVLFQQSLHEGVFKERRKRANVMPLYKGKG